MSWYRRTNRPGGTYFFTVITHERKRFLTSDLARKCLKKAFEKIRDKRPFQMEGFCLLPDHLHCIWVLPENDKDFSVRWGGIKSLFTFYYRDQGGRDGVRNKSRERSGEAAIWQRRFWEHLIRDQEDFAKHMDYLHYNPVKHGLVCRVADWQWSTFHHCVKEGYYKQDWGNQKFNWIEQFQCVGE